MTSSFHRGEFFAFIALMLTLRMSFLLSLLIINIFKYLFYSLYTADALWCYYMEEEEVVQIIRRRFKHYLNFNGFL